MMRLLVTGGSGFIGSHLLERLSARGAQLANLDVRPPPHVVGNVPWYHCDIKDASEVHRVFGEFRPTHVVHLAANTDLAGETLVDYQDNVAGTRIVIEAAKAAGSVERLITTSTQYVVTPGRRPASPTDFAAYSAYGMSKVETERLTRETAAPMVWTIIRPTNIWGPRHPFLPDRVWYYMARGLYVHPGRRPIARAYASVEAVTYQIDAMLRAPAPTVDGRVYYVGEKPVEFLFWANAFAVRLTGKPVRVIPRPMWRTLALIGDVVPKFPMNSARFERLTVDDDPPIEPTYEAFGVPPVDFDAAVAATVDWLWTYWRDKGYRISAPNQARPMPVR